jgi:hypothetical protein
MNAGWATSFSGWRDAGIINRSVVRCSSIAKAEPAIRRWLFGVRKKPSREALFAIGEPLSLGGTKSSQT